jgi:hypothetical protein
VQPLLANERSEGLLSSQGYLVVDALDAEGVQELRDLHAELGFEGPGFDRSIERPAGTAKDEVRRAAVRVYERDLASLAPGLRCVLGTFLSKGSSGESAVPTHQDWSLIDESAGRMLVAFIALGDIDETSGSLAVVPRSHLLPTTRRGWGTPPNLVLVPDALRRHLRPVPLRAGQALLYDSRIVHGSPTNRSGRPRVALGMGLIPPELGLVHYLGDGGGGAELLEYAVDERFYELVSERLAEHPGPLLTGSPHRAVRATPAITEDDLDALRGRRAGPTTKFVRRVRRRWAAAAS